MLYNMRAALASPRAALHSPRAALASPGAALHSPGAALYSPKAAPASPRAMFMSAAALFGSSRAMQPDQIADLRHQIRVPSYALPPRRGGLPMAPSATSAALCHLCVLPPEGPLRPHRLGQGGWKPPPLVLRIVGLEVRTMGLVVRTMGLVMRTGGWEEKDPPRRGGLPKKTSANSALLRHLRVPPPPKPPRSRNLPGHCSMRGSTHR